LTPSNLQLLTYWGEQLHDNKLRASYIGVPLQDLEEILDYSTILREDKNIDHLALRCCRLGQNFEVITEFCELFGCQSISVPLLKDSYSAFVYKGDFKPAEIDSSIAIIQKTLGADAAQVYEKKIGGKNQRLLWYIELRGTSRFKVYTLPESKEVFQSFIREQVLIPEMYKTVSPGNPVLFHALSDGRRSFYFQPNRLFTTNLKYYSPNYRAPAEPRSTPEKRRGILMRLRERWHRNRRGRAS
jgi:hypothetical protein